MKRGEFTLATQAGNKGYFGKVAIEVEAAHDITGKVEVDFDAEHARRWQIGARFGIQSVLDHVPRKRTFPTGARIHVTSIQGHEVDTNEVVIAFAAANALLRALEIGPSEIRKPDLDTEQGLFVFPK
jgi:hypothetical protein